MSRELTSIRSPNKSIDPIVAYRNRLKVIRDIDWSAPFIEGCPAGTPLDGIGYFNSYYTGEDLYNSWQGMYALFSSINANAFLNHLVVYVMPGEDGRGAPDERRGSHEAETLPRWSRQPAPARTR